MEKPCDRLAVKYLSRENSLSGKSVDCGFYCDYKSFFSTAKVTPKSDKKLDLKRNTNYRFLDRFIWGRYSIKDN